MFVTIGFIITSYIIRLTYRVVYETGYNCNIVFRIGRSLSNTMLKLDPELCGFHKSEQEWHKTHQSLGSECRFHFLNKQLGWGSVTSPEELWVLTGFYVFCIDVALPFPIARCHIYTPVYMYIYIYICTYIYTPAGFGPRKNKKMAGVYHGLVYLQTAPNHNTCYIHHPWCCIYKLRYFGAVCIYTKKLYTPAIFL